MKSTKQLLILLKENRDSFDEGLCSIVSKMISYNIITFEEYCKLDDFITKKSPAGDIDNNKYYPYGWEPGKWRPRVIWINKQIKKLTK
jgi:hypothetical protein